MTSHSFGPFQCYTWKVCTHASFLQLLAPLERLSDIWLPIVTYGKLTWIQMSFLITAPYWHCLWNRMYTQNARWKMLAPTQFCDFQTSNFNKLDYKLTEKQLCVSATLFFCCSFSSPFPYQWIGPLILLPLASPSTLPTKSTFFCSVFGHIYRSVLWNDMSLPGNKWNNTDGRNTSV